MKSLTLRSLPYLVILVCSVLIMGANPFKGETVAPTDILVNYPGWQNLHFDLQTRHPNRSDMLDARLPRWIQAKRALRDGELPIWNPYPVNGIPGLQWLPAAILTPAFGVFAAIGNDAAGYYFALLTNLLIAGVGTYLLLFALTRNRLAATFGALVFAFNGFHAAWFFWAHITSSIWIPWVFLCVHGYLTTRRRVYLPGLTLATALMVLGGFPTVTVYALMALAIFSLVYAPWSEGLKSVLKCALVLTLFGVMAFLITSFAIHSLYEMLQATKALELRAQRGDTPLELADFIRFVFPIQERIPSVEQTFYVGILPLLFLFAGVVQLLRGRASRGMVFALLVLAMTVSIAFGLLPRKIVWAIPTFDSNSWSRMTILLALGFAVISAEVISRLFRLPALRDLRLAPMLLVSLLIAVQFVDMRALFQAFNGPVPAATFLPKTPTIDYVQKHLKPLQSILADRVYLISGTLTSYALPEWFAHGFKTRAEKAVLDSEVVPGGHVTKTAAMIDCANVRTDGHILELLGIRYLLCGAARSEIGRTNILLTTSGDRHVPSPLITPGHPLVQHFPLPNEMEIDGIKLLMATYSKPQAYTDVSVKLYRDDQLVGSATVEAAAIQDNSWVDFLFPHPVRLGTGLNRLEVHALPGQQDGKLSVWVYPIEPGGVFIEQDDEPLYAQVAVKLFRSVAFPNYFVERHIEDNLALIENLRVTGSGYSLADLDPQLQPDYTQVQLLNRTPTEVQVRYTGEQPGWLVLPIRLYPQWRAYINDRPTDLSGFMGMLPAVSVTPGDRVSYRYEPYWLYGLGILSLITLLVTLYLTYRWRNHAP
ncbi:MAG: hypothetical protein ABW095_18005 [Candidatus Thiodiazotropha sp.]